MADSVVVLRTYSSEIQARFDATVLEANGIPAQVFADTAGGAYPSMGFLFPARLMVRVEDVALATEILDTPADPPPNDPDDEDQ
jgi:hypothetical protein